MLFLSAGLSFFYVSALFLGQMYVTPLSTAGRIAVFAMCSFGLIVTSSYVANLATYLVLRPNEQYFLDIDNNGECERHCTCA